MLFLASTILAQQKKKIDYLSMQAFVFRRSSPGQMCPVVIQPPWFSNFSESFRLSYFLGWTSSYTYAWYQLAGMSQNICKCPTILTSILSYSSRAMTATLDKTSDSLFHDFILKTFGMTPFINTFPDFMAGGAVMITALFIAAGMEVCKKSPYSILKAEAFPLNGIFWQRRGILLMLPSLALITSCHLALEFMAEDQGVMLCHIL